jgi:hypothetical protein
MAPTPLVCGSLTPSANIPADAVGFTNALGTAANTIREQLVVTTAAVGALRALTTDVDGDGDVDVVYMTASLVAWYANVQGSGMCYVQM